MNFMIMEKEMPDPAGKEKIYISGHQNDVQLFRVIANEILEIQNAIVHIDSEMITDGGNAATSAEDRELALSQMNLIVFLITRDFFAKDCYAGVYEFEYARRNKIAILPIAVEDGLDELFNRQFGSFHLLHRNASDYSEKLKHFIDLKFNQYHNIGKPPIPPEKCKSARAFISYRKKDRVYANAAINLIRSIKYLRDMEIWYDDFLTEGENYNSEIDENLTDSDIFILIITPNLLQEGNYVMNIEYPRAKTNGKIIIPLLMADTDITMLAAKYEGIGGVINSGDINAVSNAFCSALKALGRTVESYPYSPDKLLMLGIAYLEGKGMEINPALGMEMLHYAAEGGSYFACSRMGNLYYSGIGVTVDYEKARQYYMKAEQLCGDEFIRSLNSDNEYDIDVRMNGHATLLEKLTDCCIMCKDNKTAKEILKKRGELLKVMHSRKNFYSLQNTPGENYLRLAQMYHDDNEYAKAYLYYKIAEKEILSYEKTVDHPTCKKNALVFYYCIGKFYYQLSRINPTQNFRMLAVDHLLEALTRSRYFNKMYQLSIEYTRELTGLLVSLAFDLEKAGDINTEIKIFAVIHNEYLRFCEETQCETDYITLADAKLNYAVLAKPENGYELLCQAYSFRKALYEAHPENNEYLYGLSVVKKYLDNWGK